MSNDSKFDLSFELRRNIQIINSAEIKPEIYE